MVESVPTFPPLLNGNALAASENPMKWAVDRAQARELGAGDLVWSQANNRLRFALVLEPEVERTRCAEMVYLAMVAFGDAAGALIPPEVAITYQWPNVVQMNDGQIGNVDLIVSDDEFEGIPAWMVLSLDVQLTPDFADMNPGENYHRTTMWDEGCGEFTRTELLDSTSRHLVNAIHTWSEDGFKSIHQQWHGRLNKDAPFARGFPSGSMNFIGIDEIGNGLLTKNKQTISLPVAEALGEMRNSIAGVT